MQRTKCGTHPTSAISVLRTNRAGAAAMAAASNTWANKGAGAGAGQTMRMGSLRYQKYGSPPPKSVRIAKRLATCQVHTPKHNHSMLIGGVDGIRPKTRLIIQGSGCMPCLLTPPPKKEQGTTIQAGASVVQAENGQDAPLPPNPPCRLQKCKVSGKLGCQPHSQGAHTYIHMVCLHNMPAQHAVA